MIDLKDYGYIPSAMEQEENSEWIPARITAVHKERYELVCAHGISYGRLKTGVYYGESGELFPTTGDFVLIRYNGSGDSQIVRTLERRSFFSRRDPTPGRGGQAVAANFDYVFIMASLNFDFNLKRLERYLTLAWQSGAVPAVVLTKADLAEDSGEQLRTVEKMAPGVGAYAVSATTGQGLEALSAYLKPRKTVVLLGSSGVGKSSLVNALCGGEVMATGSIREDDSRGRHTTTRRQLIRLPGGVMMIDTPGMRELGMWDVGVGLNEAFGDVERYFGSCRFSDCRHQNEPGCAVKAALASGQLSPERWESYQKLKNEARYSDDKAVYLREKTQRFKQYNKWNKQRGKGGGLPE